MNITLHYLYRDHSNYKRHGSVIFSNPHNLPLEEIETAIRQHIIDGEWFVHSVWGLPDLLFEKTDCEVDHGWHEYSHLELAAKSSGPVHSSIDEFFLRIAGR